MQQSDSSRDNARHDVSGIDSSTASGRRVDDVKETWQHAQMGVKVERVVRKGYEKDQKLLKVYGKRSDRYESLTGDEPTTNERWVKLAEFPPTVATEVLFGLAAAHGYELEGK